MITNKLEGKIAGVFTRTQKGIHNAKIVSVNPDYVILWDRNDNRNFKYKQSSITRVNCGNR